MEQINFLFKYTNNLENNGNGFIIIFRSYGTLSLSFLSVSTNILFLTEHIVLLDSSLM